MNTRAFLMAVLVAGLVGAPAMAQPKKDAAPGAAKQPEKKADDVKRVGYAYPLATCPITGKKLGSMGDPIVKVYDGREIRYCCDGCPEKFEKDLAKSMAKLDEAIIKDQTPLYPLKTSVVSGKELPAKPVDFVYGNRLVRVADEGEKAEFSKDSKKYFAALDKAVVDAQGKSYAIAKCPVSGEEIGADDKPFDMVVAGRLVRLCCKDCVKDVEKNPAKFVAMVDDARAGKGGKTPDKSDKKDEGHKDHGK